MNFIKRLSLVFLIAILGVYEVAAAHSPYSLGLADAVYQPFKRPLSENKKRPGADSPLVPHSPSTSPVSSTVSGEENDQSVPLKRACGGGSTDGSSVTASAEEDVLPRTAGGSPTLSALVRADTIRASHPQALVYRPRLSLQQQAAVKARKAQFGAAAHVPALIPASVPVADAESQIIAVKAYTSPDFQKASTIVEPVTNLAVYNLRGNWILDKKGNYQISEVGCTVTNLGKEKIATVFFNASGYGAYVSPAFMADKKALLGKHVKIMGPGDLAEELTNDIAVVNSTWDKIALFKTFGSFEEGQAWVEQVIADLGISLEKKPA